MNKTIFVLFIFSIGIVCSCTSGQNNETSNSSQATEAPTDPKSQIREFWSNYRKAQKLRVQKEWDQAIEYYLKALKIDDKHEDAWFNLGNMYLEKNEGEKARNCWRRIVDMNPSSARAHMQLGRLYLSHERPKVYDIDSAKSEFQQAFELNKIVTGPLMLLGHVAMIENQDELAIKYISSVVGSDAKSVEAHFLLGYLSWKKGNMDRALSYYTKAIELSAPEKAIKGVMSEGDTKDGAVHLRPINESLFYTFYADLGESENVQDAMAEMEIRYIGVEKQLGEIRTFTR